MAAPLHRLGGVDGQALLTAHEALIKGALESEVPAALLIGTRREPWSALYDIPADEFAQHLLRLHALRIMSAPHSGRAVSLALAEARSGRGGVALVANDQLDHALAIIRDAAATELPDGAALALVLEDRPRGTPATCPRQAARRLGIPSIEAGDVLELRDAVESALRLSRARKGPVALVVHHQVLRSRETIAMRPNRVVEDAGALALHRADRARRSRRIESSSVLRTARRLELNRSRCLPSPGELVPVGFITVGPADAACRHLVHVLRLSGRVPVLRLGLLDPLDEVAIERIVTRCRQVIVLEPRPGVMEREVLAAAERIRRRGAAPGLIWGRELPAEGDGEPGALDRDDVLHPSILARKIAHLLHGIRPAMQVASMLVPEAPAVDLPLPPRGAELGPEMARRRLEDLLEETDDWLADGAPLEERDIPTSTIAVDGVYEADTAARVVTAEIWEAGRFQEEGISGLRQAARALRPWIFLICDLGTEDTQDLERLARAVVPEERADRVRIALAQLADEETLRDLLREAALEERLTVIIVGDGSPARFDANARERELAEIDRLGFEPEQQTIRAADVACRFGAAIEDGPELGQVDAGAMRTAFSIDRLPRRVSRRARIGMMPRLERVRVVRTRPPAATWRREFGAGLPLPVPLHAEQPRWRAHLAGYRGVGGGPATAVICEAGRLMGYAVSCLHATEPIGPGRRAWSQILLTNPRPGETAPPLGSTVPFGEADLLLGLDPSETLRAIALDASLQVAFPVRTCAVINRGAFAGDGNDPLARRARHVIEPVAESVTRPGELMAGDVAGACRAWFRTDRVTDLVLLGIAFQRGYVPLSVDAIETAIERVEDAGYARSAEAYRFGRRLALEAPLWSRPRLDAGSDVGHLVRRCRLLYRRSRRGGPARAERLDRLLNLSLEAMPGLMETGPGRTARRDFVLAAWRCVRWGGLEYAQRYADLVAALYRADRGDMGRALTRDAVLPLAEAMLIREPLYVLAMATGPQQGRRTRLQLNVKPARGDRIVRSYLVRCELIAFRRRFRQDVRIGEGTARAVAALRHVLPWSWRGWPRQRELARYVEELVRRATLGADADYGRWQQIIHRLNELAVDDRLRSLTTSELEEQVEGEEDDEAPKRSGR